MGPETAEHLRHQLIALAAQMVRRQNMPTVEEWPWGKRMPRFLFDTAHRDCARAKEQCGLWGIALRDIADSLIAKDSLKS